MIDYRKIECFLKAAERLNFSQAARELFISPQALNQQIAKMEEDLGTRLFSRSTRQISLTESGRICQRELARLKLEYDKAMQTIRQETRQVEKSVSIGFFNALPKNEIVTPWVGLIQSTCGQDHVDMTSGNLSAVWRDLEDGEIDLALSNFGSYVDLSEYETAILLTVPARIVVSLSHPWAKSDQVSEADWADADMVKIKINSRPPQKGSFYDLDIARHVRYVSDFDAMLAVLESGKYFAVFPTSFGYKDQARFRYFDLPDNHRFDFHTACICKTDNPKPIVHQLMDQIRVELSNLTAIR